MTFIKINKDKEMLNIDGIDISLLLSYRGINDEPEFDRDVLKVLISRWVRKNISDLKTIEYIKMCQVGEIDGIELGLNFNNGDPFLEVVLPGVNITTISPYP